MSVCSSLNPNPLFTSPSISTSAPPRTLFFTSPYFNQLKLTSKPSTLFSISAKSDSDPNPNPKPKPKSNSKPKRDPSSKLENSQNQAEDNNENFPKTIPRKPRRGRRSEAVAVEDFVRDKLEQTFESIRQQSSQILEDKEKIFKDKPQEQEEEDDRDINNNKRKNKKGMVVEEDDPNWPLDADIGWGIRASEYFDKHSIKNTVGEDGVEIDWEGELDDNYVKEINCLEWESFAFHPSPLIVLVFERYNRANDNWRFLKELEKAIKVYWNAKDRLPPRTVKIDINIERDLAYALKVRECPQLLFLKGNTILYREKDIRTADELVQMIAHFYYNARKPSWIDDTALAPPY